MSSEKSQVTEFLNHYHMNHQAVSLEDCCRQFLQEMERGLRGERGTLQMFPTYLEVRPELPVNEPVIVIDAGGTNLRVGMIHFDLNRQPVLENFSKYPMPGSQGEVGKEQFFTTIAGYLAGLLERSRKIGFCFSYPTEMFPNKDGRLIQFSKQIQAAEVIGELIAANLQSVLRKMGHSPGHRVVLLNDTVATLLAGRAAFGTRTFDSYVGFILGTGINSCYIERNANIRKCPDLIPAQEQIINVESGGFGLGPAGILDREFDQTTVDPGRYTFEKMISGRYLGGVCRQTIRRAAADGLFAAATADNLQQLEELSTVDLNRFLLDPDGPTHPLGAALAGGPEADRTKLYYLLDSLVERAAKLAAANLSAMVLQSGKGTRPEHPVCINADGTTFYQLKALRFKTEYYLQRYLVQRKGRFWEITGTDNAPLIGAAIAGLTN